MVLLLLPRLPKFGLHMIITLRSFGEIFLSDVYLKDIGDMFGVSYCSALVITPCTGFRNYGFMI